MNKVTTEQVKKIISDFVIKEYGVSELKNPSWKISALAKYIASAINNENKEELI